MKHLLEPRRLLELAMSSCCRAKLSTLVRDEDWICQVHRARERDTWSGDDGQRKGGDNSSFGQGAIS